MGGAAGAEKCCEIATLPLLTPNRSFVNHINEKINKSKRFIGILEYLSQYLPLKTLDQMYKIFIRPHFDYCDVIYRTPCLKNPFESSITLNILTERVEKSNIKQLLLLQELRKVLVETNYMTNLVGKVSLIGDGAGTSFLKFQIT